ncbi:MAG: SusF/SusE family outer membrane protein [Reichenbachiella sp.]
MKMYTRLLTFFMSILVASMFIACEDDEPTIPEGGDGILVADGFFITKAGVEPVSTSQLKSAQVDAPDFGAMAREGFLQGYVYLTAGNYNIVEVFDKAIVTTIGGTLEEVTEVNNPECDESGYSLVSAATDGAAFAVSADGLYVIAYDQTLGEIAFDQIEGAGIIGGATVGGWSNDTPLTGSVTAEGGSWSATEVTLDVNQMKFRFNCRWAIDRRLDTDMPFDNANGYSFFTNYGGTFDNLLPGNEGANIEIAEYAEYTVAMMWDPSDGFTAELTRTGDAVEKPDYSPTMFMVGDALNGWDLEGGEGIAMVPVHSNDHLFWGIAWLETGGGFKFAPEELWAGDFGITGTATDGVYAQGSDNVPAPATSGYYMIVVNLDPAGPTVEVNAPLVYGLGEAFDGDWTGANDTYKFTVDNSNSTDGSISFSNFPTAGNLRMHVTASTFLPVGEADDVQWWQAEFAVIDGAIEYRAKGGDQAAVAVTAGGSVSLNFKAGTGVIQ